MSLSRPHTLTPYSTSRWTNDCFIHGKTIENRTIALMDCTDTKEPKSRLGSPIACKTVTADEARDPLNMFEDGSQTDQLFLIYRKRKPRPFQASQLTRRLANRAMQQS